MHALYIELSLELKPNQENDHERSEEDSVRLQPLFRIALQLRLSERGHAGGLQVRSPMPLRGRVHEESVGAFASIEGAAAECRRALCHACRCPTVSRNRDVGVGRALNQWAFLVSTCRSIQAITRSAS